MGLRGRDLGGGLGYGAGGGCLMVGEIWVKDSESRSRAGEEEGYHSLEINGYNDEPFFPGSTDKNSRDSL